MRPNAFLPSRARTLNLLPSTVLTLAVLLTGQVSATELASRCSPSPAGGATFDFDLGSNLADFPETSGCSPWVCRTPSDGGTSFQVVPAGCDPTTTTCGLRLNVPVTVEGNHQFSNQNETFRLLWFSKAQPDIDCYLPGSTCNPVSACGELGGTINTDTGTAWVQVGGLSCSNLTASALKTYSLSVYTCRGDFTCERRLDIEDLQLTPAAAAQALGCPPAPRPPASSCNGDADCRSCQAGLSVGGGGDGQTPPGSGPGALLRHQAGGTGSSSLPGSAAWSAALGRGWSHDYAERIVVDPDDSHVWLLTRFATFREFSGLSAGIYSQVAPTDEDRTLSRTGGGWELRSLDGTVETFGSDGRWLETADRNGNGIVGTYNGSGQLVTVTKPDGRSETFTYEPGGKLSAITEIGVDGTTTRTWSYSWQGDDLVQIDQPDGRGLRFTYSVLGRMSRMIRVGLDDGDPLTARPERVLQGWGYDSSGNAVRTWKGSLNYQDSAATEKWEITFTNPSEPTAAMVKDPLGRTASYTLGRDPVSRKPRVETLSGDCPVCGSGPNLQLFYEDSTQPLRPTREIDGLGRVTLTSYNSHGRVEFRTEAAGTSLERTTAWTYDVNFPALATSIQMPSVEAGHVRQSSSIFDLSTGDLLSRTETGREATYPGGAFSLTTGYTYNSAGQPLSIDPPGSGTADQTSFTYDATRGDLLPLTRTDPVVGTSTFTYDAFNRRTTVTDANGVVTETSYDAMNRPTSVIQHGDVPANDLVTQILYNRLGDLYCQVLPRGNAIEYAYDSAGRLTQIRRGPAVGSPSPTLCLDTSQPRERQLFTLNAVGLRTNAKQEHSTSSSAWSTETETSFVFSTRCHLDKVIQAPGKAEESVTENAYDCAGNLIKVWDGNHPSSSQTAPASTEYAYDELNRLTTILQPWGGGGGGNSLTSYQYDVQNHLVEVNDAERNGTGAGNLTSFTYSDRDLMTEEASPVSGVTVHSYDDHGSLLQSTDARGVTATRSYDAADRLLLVDLPGTAYDSTYVYDDPLVPFSKGRLTSLQRGNSAIDYLYDRFGRTTQDGSLAFTYDKNGNRASLVYPGGVTATYGYDSFDRPTSLAVAGTDVPQTLVTAATYRAYGPLATLTLANGLKETRSYNFRNAPTEIKLAGTSGSPVRLDWLYTLDKVGNPTQIQQSQPTPTVTRTFAYQDYQYYLTTGNGPWGNQSWTYDRLGNRLTETTASGTDTYTYALNPSGGHTALLSSVALGTGGSRNYTFGPAGHLDEVSASGNTIIFSHDDTGQLSRLERQTDLFTDFSYDGRGFLATASGELPPTLNLFSTKEPPRFTPRGTPGTPIFADGFEDGTACAWTTTFGTVTPPPTSCPQPTPVTATSTYGSDARLYHLGHDGPPDQVFYFYFGDRPVAQLEIDGDNEAWKWLTTDHLGTPIAATGNSTGTPLWLGGFEPFGGDFSGASTQNVQLRFPGQWTDASWEQASLGADVYYNVNRWYGWQDSRYERVDPLQRLGATPYGYAIASPIRWVDPSGLIEVQVSREPNSEVVKFCENGRALGCARLHQYFSCKCDCHGVISVTGGADFVRLAVSTDCDTPAGEIFSHEFGHLDELEEEAAQIRQFAAKWNGRKFDSEDACNSACSDLPIYLKTIVGPTMLQGLFHAILNPARACHR